jgi:hypothetical protein
MDWIGSVLIVLGMWAVTERRRWGWVVYGVGEIVYCVYAYQIAAWGLLALGVVFTGLCLKGFYEAP